MNNKISIAALTTFALVMGCSTPPTQVIEAFPPQESRPLPLEPPPESNIAGGKICQLGTTCLAMDPRPFEVCLLGTQKRCSDKAREPMRVENPEVEPR